eukprot:CAMPEP_0170342034 /NCGR_PEP_ID=MMETSP0116_2-20130129/72158_1 /TAXON_ID=400756 /ORGANISM="Durinskia baltica, Strain CSIRO CS-38" /LENGTH=81 /DNA_ID=CAMNT_0010595619 /DNA_START=10 /DNA_END=251 /DNA_ORIENTATION=-
MKGLISEVPDKASGTLTCTTVGGDVVELGKLLAADDPAARQLQAQQGFASRLQWADDGWQEAADLLDLEGCCEVRVVLSQR